MKQLIKELGMVTIDKHMKLKFRYIYTFAQV